MKRLERIVVHVEEALRLAGQPGEAHQRLALLLLDSAAELLLHRACQRLLVFVDLNRQRLERMREDKAAGVEFNEAKSERLQKLEQSVPTAKQLERIDRVFDAKAEYLQSHNALDPAKVRVLSKLHRYRNEAYHQDKVRDGSLSSAVRIYAYLVCTLLRDLETDGIMVELAEPPGLKPYMDRYPGVVTFDLRPKIAEELLERPEVASQDDLGAALAAHLDDRLQGVSEGLEYAASTLTEVQGQDWDQESLLRLLQAGEDVDRFVAPNDLKRRVFPVSTVDLHALRARSEAVVRMREPIAAFREFANIEDAFEPVEVQLEDMLIGIDQEIQLQIDIGRGK